MPVRQRALLLVHPYFRPDRGKPRSATEKDVWMALKRLGFDVRVSVAQAGLKELDRDLAAHRPHFVFNLLEEFRGEGVFDFHPVSFLEASGIAYTGCNPRGLIVSRNKVWTANIARGCGVRAPTTWPAATMTAKIALPYPAILKFNNEHASLGMTAKNLVRDFSELRRRRSELAAYEAELIAQEFIPGRELSVGVIGNVLPKSFHPRELRLDSPAGFMTERVKFSAKHRARRGIRAAFFHGDKQLLKELESAASRVFTAMGMSGYARMDFRLDRSGRIYLIDANANPNLARDEDLARSAKRAGLDYEALIRRIIRLAKDYRPLS